MKIAMANSQRGEGGLPVIPRRPLHSLSVANAHRCRDTRAGQFRVPWREESIEMRPSAIARESGAFLCEGGRSGLSERAWRPARPSAEGSVERGRFGVLQEECDIADAQTAILQQGTREVPSDLIENLAE